MSKNIQQTLTLIITFIFIVNFAIFGMFLVFGIYNDYILYTISQVADGMVATGAAPAVISQQITAIGAKFITTFDYMDLLLISMYVFFVLSTFYLSYVTDRDNYFTAFGALFFVGMFFMLFLSYFTNFSSWWQAQVLVKMLPNIAEYIPMWSYIFTKIGLLSFIQFCICIALNIFDFDLSGIFSKKKKEQVALEADEVL